MRTRLASGEALAGTFVKSRDPSTTEALAASDLTMLTAMATMTQREFTTARGAR